MAQHASAVANKRTARQHADGANQVPRQPHGKVGIKIIVKRQQSGGKHQAQRPVLQQQQQFGGDTHAAPGAVEIGNPANHLENDQRHQRHQQMEI